MKRFYKNLLLAGLLCFTILAATSCSGNWEPPYEDLNENGYSVSVKFDANGGVFAGTNDVYVVDVFDARDVTDGGVYLLSPDDSLRAEGAFTISRNGYFLAGWYTEKMPRTDEDGNPLDDYGVPTNKSGRPQGFSYSNKWDFENDKLTVDKGTEYSAENPVCTLYAAWIPYFSYEFYVLNSDAEFELFETKSAIDLSVPEWNKETGKIDNNSFPERDGYTFSEAYTDKELTVPLTEKICGADMFVDYGTGTTSTEKICIYTKWLEGNWYQIHTAKQLFNNSRLDGNYILCADLDFENEVWAPALTKGKFTGKIYGNGHKISNINVVQADNSQLFGGLFGSIESTSVFDNVSFENISFEIQAGSRMKGASFGLLAGTISEGAVFSEFDISGRLTISDSCYPDDSYSIGLLCGAGQYGDISISKITCSPADGSEKVTTVTEADGTVTVTFN